MPMFFSEQLRCFVFDDEDLRAVIKGEIVYGQCPQCNGTGRENWDENGEDLRPGPSDNPNRETGRCENCEGVGYIVKQDNR